MPLVGAVLDQGDLAVLEVVGRDVVQEVLHRDEHARVVGRGREDQVTAAEGVGHDVACGGDGGVMHAHLDALLAEPGRKDVGGVFGVAVDRGVGDHDALFLGGVARPEQVLLEEIAEVAAPDETVQRADIGDVELCGLLQHRLHLRAVLAHDVGVVAAGLVDAVGEEVDLIVEEPAVEGAEAAEGVRGEEDFVGGVVGHHDLGPVHHRRHDEGEAVAAGGEGVALLDEQDALREIHREKLRQHGLDLRVADDGGLGVARQHELQRRGVVGLHVVHHEIIELPPAELMGEVFEEHAVHGLVHGVEEHRLLIEQEVGVIGNAVGHAVDALEEGQPPVVCADPDQIVQDFSCAIHKLNLLCYGDDNIILAARNTCKRNRLCGRNFTIDRAGQLSWIA